MLMSANIKLRCLRYQLAETFKREGFMQNSHNAKLIRLMNNYLSRMGCHRDHWKTRIILADPIGQLKSILAWHDDNLLERGAKYSYRLVYGLPLRCDMPPTDWYPAFFSTMQIKHPSFSSASTMRMFSVSQSIGRVYIWYMITGCLLLSWIRDHE